MDFVDFKKEVRLNEQIRKHKDEAVTLKFKTTLFEGLANKVREYQFNDGPIAKIDHMDYEHISLDTITKIPNTLHAPLHDSLQTQKNKYQEEDAVLLKTLFSD